MTEINENVFTVIVKPNSERNEILRYDEEKKAYIIRIKAAATEGKANKELVKFLTKELKKKITILHGLTTHQKMIAAEEKASL